MLLLQDAHVVEVSETVSQGLGTTPSCDQDRGNRAREVVEGLAVVRNMLLLQDAHVVEVSETVSQSLGTTPSCDQGRGNRAREVVEGLAVVQVVQ